MSLELEEPADLVWLAGRAESLVFGVEVSAVGCRICILSQVTLPMFVFCFTLFLAGSSARNLTSQGSRGAPKDAPANVKHKTAQLSGVAESI